MALNAHGIVIELIGDEKSYLRSVENTLSANAELEASFKQVGVDANLSADAQIKAAVRAHEALRINAVTLASRAQTLPGGSREQAAATLLAAEAQAKYARAVGGTSAASHGLSKASADAERGIGRAVRGAVAGSGAFHRLGRSVAFASLEFLGLAVGVSAIKDSIEGAERLAKAQDSLAVAIEHTGGNLAVLQPQYLATAKAAKQFGISEEEALTGLARATVLTGDAESAQRAYTEALVISKALGKDFTAVLTATSKAQEGSTTSLRRYGVLLPTTATGQEQLNQVMARFEGQAAANTTESDKLHASVANFEATLGTALLPTFDSLISRLGAWLDKTSESGELQKAVNEIVDTGATVFVALGDAVGVVDKVTGSLASTLKLLIGLKLASVLAGWAGGFRAVAAAEGLAAGGAVAGGAAGGAAGAGVAARVAMYTGAGAAGGVLARGGSFARLGRFGVAAAATFGGIPDQKNAEVVNALLAAMKANPPPFASDFGKNGFFPFPSALGGNAPGVGSSGRNGVGLDPAGYITQIRNFQIHPQEQLLQAQAALTRGTQDDVHAAQRVIAQIKRQIARGRLHGAALVAALQAEAGALSTVWAAEDAAAQKRAARAEAARQRIEAQIQNSIDPLKLEVALSRAQALGKPLTAILKKMRAAAYAALNSGKLSLEQQKEAWDQITSLNQQLANQSTAQVHQFHQLRTRALTAGLHLTDAQRAELRARLSQLGPGNTGPGSGVGAYGYVIQNHHHVTVELDGEKVGRSVTRSQQRRHRRDSSQRRGPNAGD